MKKFLSLFCTALSCLSISVKSIEQIPQSQKFQKQNIKKKQSLLKKNIMSFTELKDFIRGTSSYEKNKMLREKAIRSSIVIVTTALAASVTTTAIILTLRQKTNPIQNDIVNPPILDKSSNEQKITTEEEIIHPDDIPLSEFEQKSKINKLFFAVLMNDNSLVETSFKELQSYPSILEEVKDSELTFNTAEGAMNLFTIAAGNNNEKIIQTLIDYGIKTKLTEGIKLDVTNPVLKNLIQSPKKSPKNRSTINQK